MFFGEILSNKTVDRETADDLVTGLMWQRQGSDIGSFRQLQTWMAGINQAGLAGFDDWRLPTIEEALSLLRQEKAKHGLHIHPCFTGKQGVRLYCRPPETRRILVCRSPAGQGVWGIRHHGRGGARLCRTPA